MERDLRRLDIKLSFKCNNHCKFCVQGEKRNYCKDRSSENVKNILMNFKKRDYVVFTGGEPTIRADIFELVKFSKSLNFKTIQIQTNGRMFAYEDFCKSIIDSGANEFSPAIHGPDEETHDFLTSVPGSFKQTIRGIVNLKKMGQYIISNTVITATNYKFLPKIAKLLVSLGVDQFQFAFLHIAGTALKNKDWIVPKKSIIIPYVLEGLNIGIKSGRKVTTEAIPYCFMKGYENSIAENYIPKTKVFDQYFTIDDYTKYRITKGKAKNQKCKKCFYDYICEGPWREYPEIFGWDEFKPVIDSEK
ncbi:MAG: radical SAM protein [Candidatus Omnitrophica bacterium]|nr:radical SAM protein [Candidatus Omnitrophota bacterium]MDD5352613.1 radical SAM protein [Candidatus Omnitrophota bacterium]MDD5550211.1 radical SAM protein [Candidatus Omnitrophota bacterium]